MSDGDNRLIETNLIQARILSALRAATFTANSDVWDGLDIFSDDPVKQVKWFDLFDIRQALEELLMFKGRICVVLYGPWTYSNEILSGGKGFIATRTSEVELIVSDRDYGNRQDAVTGDADNPGINRMVDSLLPAVCRDVSQSGDAWRIPIRPSTGEIMRIQGDERDELTGRVAWRQAINVPGGSLRFSVNRTVR